MPTKYDLELENRALKRKLEEKERDLQEKERNLEEKEDELGMSKSKLTKLDTLMKKVKEKIECPVCLDIPRKSPVPVCPNGHFVCEKCKTDSCPSCRVGMGQGKSLLAATILEHIDHQCNFTDCDQSFPTGDLVEHEAICPHRTVTCPRSKCNVSVSLAKLADHLINSPSCCSQTMNSLHTQWNRCSYKCKEGFCENSFWHLKLVRYSGKSFAVYPIKNNGQYYFLILMLDCEDECTKFKFEMIIHEKGSDPLESENVVKFQGSPLSVDSKEEERNIYGVNNQLMNRIFKNLELKEFSLSFKLTKRDLENCIVVN